MLGRVGLVLAVVVLAATVTIVSATFGKDPDVLEVGKIGNDKIREAVEEALRDGKLTVGELKMIHDIKAKILVAENSEVAELLKKLHPDYDLIISGDMASKLDKKLKEGFKKKYGYLPEEVGRRLSDDEVRELAAEGKLELDKACFAGGKGCSGPGNPYNPPYADENGKIYVLTYSASDDQHAPAGGVHWDDVVAGTWPFERDFGVDIIRGGCYNCWDASGVDNNLVNLIGDLRNDVDYGTYNTVVIGWVRYGSDYKGYADIDGHYSVIAESFYIPFPNDAVVQHEVSHNFDAEDGKCTDQCSGECVMNSFYVFLGTDKWCDHHRFIVRQGVWGPHAP